MNKKTIKKTIKQIEGFNSLVINFILFVVAYILFSMIAPLCFVFMLVFGKGRAKYLRNCAYSIDQSGNVFCQNFLNRFMANEYGYKFGNPDETISSVLGRNQLRNTLTLGGKILAWVLHLIDKNHCIKSIEKNI